jgi:uncharacterized YkwD family protein
MKNKIIVLSLLITAMSVVPAFGATKEVCNNLDVNKILSNNKIIQKSMDASQLKDLLSSNSLKSKGLPSNILSLLNGKTTVADLLKKLEVKAPEVKKPEVKAPEVKKPEVKAPIVKQPEVKAPVVKKPVVKAPVVKQPEVKAPVVKKPEVNNNTNGSVSSYERQVADLVNAERAKAGLAPLTLDSSISNVARAKSKDMADNNYFAHTSPTYGSAGSMLSQFGIKYTAWGENIASGQKTPQQVVTAWMNSQGHRENIMSSTYTKLGVGYATNSKGVPYWTQMFVR